MGGVTYFIILLEKLSKLVEKEEANAKALRLLASKNTFKVNFRENGNISDFKSYIA